MKLQINGQDRESAATTVAELVEQLGLKGDRVAIELNRDIVPRGRWADTPLKEGDRLEMVHFVGGGSDMPFRFLRKQPETTASETLLSCPTCQAELILEKSVWINEHTEERIIVCETCRNQVGVLEPSDPAGADFV